MKNTIRVLPFIILAGLLAACGNPIATSQPTDTPGPTDVSQPMETSRPDDPSPDVEVPARQPLSESQEHYVPPGYVYLDAFEEREIVVGTGAWLLPGTFTLPVGEGPFPVVLLVHDSGPHDRDETIGFNKPFRDLAWGLASQGIAVMRYEKRTKKYAERVKAMQQEFTVDDETINDALAAVLLLSRMKDVDAEHIFVLGHGLGGMLVPRLGALAPNIAGFVIMAGPTRPLEDVYLEQVSYILGLDGELSDKDKGILEEVEEQVMRVKDPGLSAATPPSDLPLDVPASYWLDLRGYDPPEAATELSQPMLILQGGRDYQVTLEDFEGWRLALSSRDGVEFKLYSMLDHQFIEGEEPSTPSEDFTSPGHVAESVIDDIVGWIKQY